MSKFLESCARGMVIATIGFVDYRTPPPRKKRKSKKKKGTDVAINNVVIAPKTTSETPATSETEKEGEA